MLDPGTKVRLVDKGGIPDEQKGLVGKVGTVVTSSDREAVVQLEEDVGDIGNYVAPIDFLERVN